MRFRRRIFALLAVCSLAVSAALLAAANRKQDDKSYIVRLSGDAVAVYEVGSDVPLGNIDVRPAELPEEDRRLLECGIIAEDDERLMAIIEDYTG